jgi:membrane associated rhomboid family serine protease
MFAIGPIFPLYNEYVSYAFSTDWSKIPLACWMFISYMFEHRNIWHLLINLFFFYWLGWMLESAIGARRMALFIAITGISAGLVHYGANPELHSGVTGLSGVVWGLIAIIIVSAMHWGVLAAITLGLLFGSQVNGLASATAGARADYILHLSGFLTALLLWVFWLKKPIDEFKQTEFGRTLFSLK